MSKYTKKEVERALELACKLYCSSTDDDCTDANEKDCPNYQVGGVVGSCILRLESHFLTQAREQLEAESNG